MEDTINNRRIGLLPFIVSRAQQYWVLAQGGLIVYYTLEMERFTGVALNQLSLEVIVAGLFAGLLVLLADWFVIFPSHMDVHCSRIPWYVRVEKKIDRVVEWTSKRDS